MAWWNSSIADSRTPCDHVALYPIGLLTCLGVPWLSVPPLMSCPIPHQRRPFWHTAGAAGEFPASSEDDSSHFLTNLSTTLSGSQASSPAPQPAQDIPLSHMTAQFVFILAPPSHPPLSPSYTCPYKVLRRFPRCFLLQLGEHQETVSVSRLQPICHPTLCLLSLAREAGLLFLNVFLLSSRNLPNFLQSLLLKCSSSVLYLPLDHCSLGNFLLVFQIRFHPGMKSWGGAM
jgi:hypothetical protein